MRWTVDDRRETDWERWFAWHAVPLETISTGPNIFYSEKKLNMVRWETIERRRVALPNARTVYVYRTIGSEWDTRKESKRPPPPPVRPVTGKIPPWRES